MVFQYYPALSRPLFNLASAITTQQVAGATDAAGDGTVVSEFYLSFSDGNNTPILQGVIPWVQTFSGYDVAVKTLIVKNELIPRYTGDKPVITVTVDMIPYTVNAGDTIYIPLNYQSSNFAISSQCTNQNRVSTLVKGNPDALIYITTETYSNVYVQRRGTPPALCTYSEAISSQTYLGFGSYAQEGQGYCLLDVNGNFVGDVNQNLVNPVGGSPQVFFGVSFDPQFDAATPFPAITGASQSGDVELLWIKASVPTVMDFSDDPNEIGAPLHGLKTHSYIDPGGTGATRYLQEYWMIVSLDYYLGPGYDKTLLNFGVLGDQFFQQHPLQCQLPTPGGGRSWFGGGAAKSDIRGEYPWYLYNSGYAGYVQPSNPIVVSVASAIFLY